MQEGTVNPAECAELATLLSALSHLNGATIAVVGNAQSIFTKRYGDRIDSRDVVIRMNAGKAVSPEAQGSRTDILALSMSLSAPDIAEMFGRPQVFWMTPNHELIHPSIRGDDAMLYYPLPCWAALSEKLRGNRPSTGAMVIDFLLTYLSPAKISLFGFDFKKSKTFYLNVDHIGPHDYDVEEAFVTSIVKQYRGRIYQ